MQPYDSDDITSVEGMLERLAAAATRAINATATAGATAGSSGSQPAGWAGAGHEPTTASGALAAVVQFGADFRGRMNDAAAGSDGALSGLTSRAGTARVRQGAWSGSASLAIQPALPDGADAHVALTHLAPSADADRRARRDSFSVSPEDRFDGAAQQRFTARGRDDARSQFELHVAGAGRSESGSNVGHGPHAPSSTEGVDVGDMTRASRLSIRAASAGEGSAGAQLTTRIGIYAPHGTVHLVSDLQLDLEREDPREDLGIPGYV
ncbi:MAG: hypothetical protein ACOC0P_01315 [Planctomycetota bacterium]